jgi:hypothetical protein
VKRLLLNCDQVFEVLTRGPFPTGQPEDVAVEQHLRACHDCRQLAEALRPAISLLHEAVAADEAIDLPEYQGSLPWKRPRQERRLSIARLATRREAKQNQPTVAATPRATIGQPRQPQMVSAVRFIAAGLLIAALGLLLSGTMLSSGTRRKLSDFTKTFQQPAADPPQQVVALPTEMGLLTLASLKLPATCIPLTHQPRSAEHAAEITAALEDGSLVPLRCCTECHRAGTPQPKAEQLIAITQQNCMVCHPT